MTARHDNYHVRPRHRAHDETALACGPWQPSSIGAGEAKSWTSMADREQDCI